MPTTWKTIRVFISSTFRDMQAERDHLVRFVFPKLRQELLQRRIHLVDVDLRWGVTSEQDALAVCREVVDECRPRFLCMLGGRYGWVPPGKTRSITADEVYYGVLDRDLTSRGFAYFYFRDPSATAAMVEAVPGEFREPADSHGAVALAELKTAISKAGLQPFIYRAQWDDQSRRLIGLKEFGDRVYNELLAGIKSDKDLQDHFLTDPTAPVNEFTEENAAMEAFIEERVQRFVLGSRQPVWDELQQHAESTGGNGYLCLTGAAGSGKSALLGKFCQDYRDAHPQDLVIPHFVGASSGSTDVRRTLRRLCHELVTGAGLTAEIPEDPEKLRVAFAEILQQASAQKRVVILLDAINQFDATTQLAGWSWLPEELPATARVIVSVISDQPSVISPALESLHRRRIPPKEIGLEPLTAADGEAIIREFLHRYRKSMTNDQRAALLAKADAGTPLYLLVALEELRTLGTYEEITERIAQLPPDTRALFIWILQRLEDDDGFRDASSRKIGQELVSRFVSLLGASRHGLGQQELVELLSPGDSKANPPIEPDPQGNVAALVQILRSYLMQRGELLDFYHGQFREAAATVYLPDESQRITAHDLLATHFRDKADPERNQSWKGDSLRSFIEVAFHLVGAQRTDDYCQALCDLKFVEARCRVGQVFELIADYRLAQENLPEAQADLREERTRDERTSRWTANLIEYARQWSERRDQLARCEAVTEPEPKLPEPLPSCRMWTEEEIQAECDRIIHSPTRRDQLDAFAVFVSGQCYLLLEHGQRPGFIRQHAFNNQSAGAVHDAAVSLLAALTVPYLLRRWPPDAHPNPKPALLRTLGRQTGWVECVSLTADGRRAVSGGSWDKTLRVWDIERGECVRMLEGHVEEIAAVSVTPDGRRAVSGSIDQTLRLWDLENGMCLATLAGHCEGVKSVALTPDGRRAISGSIDRTVRVWDLDRLACLWTLEGHEDSVFSVSLTPDGRYAVSGSRDGTLRVWDLENWICLRTLASHSYEVVSVYIAADGRQVVSASPDNTFELWDITSSQCLHMLKGGSHQTCVTSDGRRAVSATGDTIRIWDIESEQCLRTLEGHSDIVTSVSLTPDGRRMVSGSWDNTVRVWDLEGGLCLHTLEQHRDEVVCVKVTPDGQRAVSASRDKTLRIWDIECGSSLHTLERHSYDVESVEMTPDGRRAVSGSKEGTFLVWDIKSGQYQHSLHGIRHIGIAPDGRLVVAGSMDGMLRVWNLESGLWLCTLHAPRHDIRSVTVVPDGRRAVAAGVGGMLRVFDLESGQCLHVMEGHKQDVWCVSLTPDGRCAVSAGPDKTLRVWDLVSGACQHTMKGHIGEIDSVCVTMDSRRALSVSRDGTLRVWNLEKGQCLRTLAGHNDWVRSVSVTSDGRYAVSDSADNTLRVWDLESGQCLAVYPIWARFRSVALNGAGNIICAGTTTGEVLFLELHGAPSGPAILTATNPQQARCPVCGQEFGPPPSVVAAIQERKQEGGLSCLDLPASAFADPVLLSACLHCQHPIRFNPFYAASDDYGEILRRGLEHSRREKGDDHEETLAHLAALAVYLENTGKPDSARTYAEEYSRLVALIASQKKTQQSPEE